MIAAGRDGDDPVAIVAQATTPAQRVVETVLGRAAADAQALALETPTIIAIGPVVRLRAGLDWLGALQGRILDPDPLSHRKAPP